MHASAPFAACTSHVFTADAWMVPPECLYGCENLVPLYFMNASALATNVTAAAIAAANGTAVTPGEGDNYASLFSYDAHAGISRARADNILPAGQGVCVGGGLDVFTGVWWDAGAGDTAALFRAFFGAYLAAGGTLSRFAVRQNESMAVSAYDAAPPACVGLRWGATQADARFAADVAPALVSAGFVWDPSDPDGLYNALHGSGSEANAIVSRGAVTFLAWQPHYSPCYFILLPS